MRVVFMGTPPFAVPSLERLLSAGIEVSLVITQPDRPAGRGRALLPPPVKVVALARGLPVYQPRRLRDEGVLQTLAAARPEAIVVAAFGQLLPRAVLELPALGCLNVHASLLPRHRGAAPIPAAILAGDEMTGVTIMLMEAGLDTGPILAQVAEPIRPEDTAGSLAERLAESGARLLVDTLPRWAQGSIRPRPQDESLATYAPELKKEDGLLDWSLPAEDLWRRCRAFYPWPGAYTLWRGRPLKVLASVPVVASAASLAPGETTLLAEGSAVTPTVEGLVAPAGRLLVVGTGRGALGLLRVQAAGGRPLSGAELARGHRDLVGTRLGD